MTHATAHEKLLALAAGASLAFVAWYIYSIYLFNNQILPVQLFWALAVVLPLSLMLLWDLNVKVERQMIVILLASMVLSGLLFLRFYFYGQDLVGELYVAEMTRELGRWPLERIGHLVPTLVNSKYLRSSGVVVPPTIPNEYYSSLSVTILPSMLSQITGLSMLDTFRFLLPLVSTAIALVVFLIVRSCFNQKLALLSSIALVMMRNPPSLLRQEVALLFFLFSILYVLKGSQPKYLALSMLFLASIATAHYGLVYFAIFGIIILFFAQMLWQKTPLIRNFLLLRSKEVDIKQLDTKEVLLSQEFILFTIVIGLMWLAFVAYPIFSRNVADAIEAFQAMMGTHPVGYTPLQQHVLFSSLGAFNTVIQWLERGLAVAGGFLMLRNVRSLKQCGYVFLGGGMVALVLLFALIPNISLSIGLDRVLRISLFGFCTFLAASIFFLRNRMRWGRAISILLIVLIFLGTINIPILHSAEANLTRQEYIFSITQVVYPYQQSDFQFAQWVKTNTVPCSSFLTDQQGSNVLLFGNRVGFMPWVTNEKDAVNFIGDGLTSYFMVLTYVPGYIEYTTPNGTMILLDPAQASLLMYGNRMNLIFTNDRVTLFAYNESISQSCGNVAS